MKNNLNIPLIFLFDFLSTLKFYNAVGIIIFASIAGNYTLGMAVFSTIALSSALSELPTGILSDWMGRKNTMIAGAVCSLLGVMLFSLANNFHLLFAGGILIGIAQAFFSGNNSAILFETLKASNNLAAHHKILSRQHAVGYFARALSALIATIILFFYSDLKLLLWLTVVPQLLALIVTFLITDPKIVNPHVANIWTHLKKSILLLRKNKRAKWLSFAFVADCSIGYTVFEMITAFINTLIPTWLVGVFKTMTSIFGGIGAYISHTVTKCIGYTKGISYGIILTGLLRMISTFAGAIFAPVLFVISQLFYAITDASQQHLLQMEYSDSQRATIGSVTSLLSSIVYAIISILIGWLADVTSVQTALVVIIILWTMRILLFKKALK